MSSTRFGTLIAIAAMLMIPSAVFAQEATLSGTVTDSTGGVLPGVVVRAVHEASGNSFEGVTDGSGAFRLEVRVGAYRIIAELAGFTTVNRTGLELLVGQQGVVNLQMTPASLQESVTVTAEAPLIDTTQSSLSSNIDPRQLQELPVNGRNWIDLTMLAPGSRLNSVAEVPVSATGNTVQFQLNLDGQSVTNNMAVGFGQPRYSRDAIAEFEFISNRFDASQGRSSGVQVNAVTKSGTNTPTGSFSGYFRSDKFNAADPVAGEVIPYSDQQLSATYGGPILRDRFHYFGSFEYEREPQTYIYNTPYPYFNGTLTGTRTEKKGLGRLDYQFSPQMRLSVRGSRYQNMLPYDPRYTGGATRTMASAIGTHRRSEQLLMTFTQVIGSRATNIVKAGHDLFHWNQFAHVKNGNSLPGQTAGLGAPVITLRGLTLGQSHQLTPQDIGEQEYTIRDDFAVSYSKWGRHDLRTGAEYVHNFLFETVCNGCMGNYDLQGAAIPASITSNWAAVIPDVNDVATWRLDLLSPLARQYSRGIAMDSSPYSRPSGGWGFTEYAPRHEVFLWAQDDWQVSPKLTLNLGLRYDLEIDQYVNWVVYPPFLLEPRPQDINNFGPRLGFAYSLDDRTVLRGGAGKYYAEVTSQLSFTLRTVQSISPQVLYDGRADFNSNPFNGPAPTFDQASQRLCAVREVAGCLRPNIGNMVADDLQQPYSYQASVGVARQLGTVMSVEADYTFQGNRAFTRSNNGNITYNPDTGANYPFTGAGADVTKRVYPAYGTVSTTRTDAQDKNHAVQFAFNKRMSNNWQASATYLVQGQWNYDNYPLMPGCNYAYTIRGNEPARCDVPVTLPADIAEGGYYLGGDQRHRFTFNGIWQMPYDFQLSGIYLFGDNGRNTASSGVDTRAIGNSGGRLRANGTLIERNDFDRSAIHRVDLRVQRRLRLGRAAIDGIFEVFNVFNRANFNLWTTNESSASYGKPEQDANVAFAPRMLQLGFRATF
jgi:hypothetical protein